MSEPSPVTPELIPVRQDERFDAERLRTWLAGKIEGSDRRLTVLQFGRGKANLTYLLRFGDGDDAIEYVLRRPPLGPVAPGSHDMAREFRVLSTLWHAFPKAARAYVYCDDVSVIGAPFFVMERRHGVVVQSRVPPIFGSGEDPVANRKLSEVVIDTLVEFHAVAPTEAGLSDLGRPEGFLHRQVDGWIERWNRAAHEDNPLADELAEWLRLRLPASPTHTLVHNDWRLDNMAVAEDDPGRCVAVYDWDMCTQGDPLADVGTLMAVWYDVDEIATALNPMPTATPGFMTRREAMDRYAALSGRDRSVMGWYLVFGTFKMAGVLQQIYIRWLRGQTQDERFAVLGEGAKHLLELADARKND